MSQNSEEIDHVAGQHELVFLGAVVVGRDVVRALKAEFRAHQDRVGLELDVKDLLIGLDRVGFLRISRGQVGVAGFVGGADVESDIGPSVDLDSKESMNSFDDGDAFFLSS